MTTIHHDGGEIVELSKEVIVDTEDKTGFAKARDKRSGLVDRTRRMRQVLCYMCCSEFGCSSLKIHQKTCLKKHTWGLDLVEHEEGIPKKQSAMNRKKCTEPGPGTSLPLPSVKSKAKAFDDYNADVLRIFTEHSNECLYCRERNQEAIDNARHAAQLEEEEERQRLEDERLKRALEEEEARRLAEEAKRKHEGEMSALEEAARQRALEAAKKAEEEEARRKAELEIMMREEEDERRRLADEAAREKKRLAIGQHKYLKKHDGVNAASQAGLCYQDKKADERARVTMANMSIAHAVKENLLHKHHKVGGDTFHDSHTSKVVMVEVEVEMGVDDDKVEVGVDDNNDDNETKVS